MKYNKVVGNVGIKLDTGRLEKNIKEAQKKLNMQVAADCDIHIPFQQGALRGSIDYPHGIYGGEISWGGASHGVPYAHYQYEGELYLTEDGRSWANKNERKFPTGIPLIQHTPGTSDHWFERAKEQNLNQWVDLVKRTAGKD